MYCFSVDEYYKCKRNNSLSGQEKMFFEFYNEMDNLLGDRPMSNTQEIEYESLNSIPSK